MDDQPHGLCWATMPAADDRAGGRVDLGGARRVPVRRILLVDDQPMFTEALAVALDEQADLCVVGQARTRGEALAGVRTRSPDLVLGEVALADGSGFELLAALREVRPDLLLVVLTQIVDVSAVAEALRCGVSAWVSKAEPVAHLIAVIRRLRPGDCYVPPAMLLGAVRILAQGAGPGDGPLAELTPREHEVLQCMVGGLGREEIARELHVSPHTVRTHTQNLLAKLDAHSVVEAVAIGMRSGLRPSARGRGRPPDHGSG